jgi:RNA-binding protein Musashi
MFIGGLNWETTDESLRRYFSQFGEVLECTVMRDGATGRSRGFGFLTFKDPKTVNSVMVKEHYLDGKIVSARRKCPSRSTKISNTWHQIDPKRAIPREEQERTAKIFVGGISPEADEEDFREFFTQFGRVIDATLMIDKETFRPRGFGFVTFDSDAAVDRILASQPLELRGKQVEVKRAEPRGNVHEEGRGKFGRRGKFGQQDGSQASASDGQQAQPTSNQQGQDYSPAQMAKYWFTMQQYFAQMQQMMAMKMAQGQGGMVQQGMPQMMGNMNPAMMQQMQQMMAARMQGNQSPGMQGMAGSPQIDPAMMQQMMQQPGGFAPGGQSGPNSGMMSPGGQNKPGFTAVEQNMFEQQKYERQQAQRMAQQQFAAQHSSFGQGGPTSWEGMYDDVPQPNPPPSGPRNTSSGGGPHRGHRGGHSKQQSSPPVQSSNAPANAPTGPKNAGKPGANYRGGAAPRGGHRFHPYGR